MMLGVSQLDARGQIDPAGTGARLRLVGAGTGNVAPQIALAEPRQCLADCIARAADPRRQQIGAGVRALVGDIAQLGAQHRIGQRAGRLDPRRRGFGFGAQCGELRVAGTGEFEQAFDLAADQLPGLRRDRYRRREQQHRQQNGKGAHGPTSPLRY